jgi:hypothetical protein
MVHAETLDSKMGWCSLPRYFGEELFEFPDGACSVAQLASTLFSTRQASLNLLSNLPHLAFASKKPGMEFGMFAVCDYEIGDLILSERPLMMTPHGIPALVPKPVGCTDQEYHHIITAEWEQDLQLLFGRLLPESQIAFFSPK